jgi:Asp/Glu/hydantoin racemase
LSLHIVRIERHTLEEVIDCIFDPAVDALCVETGISIFGPTRTTLSLIFLVTPDFSIITRIERQSALLAQVVRKYRHSDTLVSTRALWISYGEAIEENIFNEAKRSVNSSSLLKKTIPALL